MPKPSPFFTDVIMEAIALPTQTSSRYFDDPNQPAIAPPTYADALTQMAMVEKLRPIFQGDARYRCAHGGRGSGKSRTFAMMSAARGYYEPIRILCGREIQNSIKESVLKEVSRAIDSIPWLRSHYTIGETFIRGRNGTEYIFKGLRHNYTEIKSMSGIAICWVEEAEAVKAESWDVLRPTIRDLGSEIWITWNPSRHDSPVQQFVHSPPSGTRITECNWRDNPFFPDVLNQERLDYERQATPELYAHIWEGQCLSQVTGAIFQYFNRDRHCIPCQPHPDHPLHFSFDFNHDPAVALVGQIIEGELWIIKEWYIRNSNTFESAGEAVAWLKSVGTRFPVAIHGDASGRQKTANSTRSNWDIVLSAFQGAGFSPVQHFGASNPAIADTLNSCNAAMRGNRIAVDPGCGELVADLENLTYDRAGGIDKRRDPLRSHLGDCFRYLVHDLLPMQPYRAPDSGSRHVMPRGVF